MWAPTYYLEILRQWGTLLSCFQFKWNNRIKWPLEVTDHTAVENCASPASWEYRISQQFTTNTRESLKTWMKTWNIPTSSICRLVLSAEVRGAIIWSSNSQNYPKALNRRMRGRGVNKKSHKRNFHRKYLMPCWPSGWGSADEDKKMTKNIDYSRVKRSIFLYSGLI